MLAVALALAASVAYGVADFAGGLAARGASVLRVVVVAVPASLVVAVVLLPVFGARWTAAALAWGAGAGVATALSFALLYRCLALGPMTVLSPITAVVSAALPVAVGLGLGERLPPLGVLGVVLALLAVVLVSAGAPGGAGNRPTAAALGIALGAGTAIAAQLVLLDAAPEDSGLAPLVASRAVACALVVAAVVTARAPLGPRRPSLRLSVAAGSLEALANVGFLLAARQGQLAVAAVVISLYPAATVLLARAVLHERLTPVQLGGLASAGGAVALLALT